MLTFVRHNIAYSDNYNKYNFAWCNSYIMQIIGVFLSFKFSHTKYLWYNTHLKKKLKQNKRVYRPGKITRLMLIRHARARKTSETCPIFWARIFCIVKKQGKKRSTNFQPNRLNIEKVTKNSKYYYEHQGT